MATHVVIGAGGTGRATAELLARHGHDVRILTRSGSDPQQPRIRAMAVDATNQAALRDACQGALTIYNCAAPAYHRWGSEFRPLATSVLRTATELGCSYVMLGNLYGYGPVSTPMTEDMPLRGGTRKGDVRVEMWEEALQASKRGDVRVTEIRASDLIGTGAVSQFTLLVAPKVLRGRTARMPADLDAPHSWTAVDDAAAALVRASQLETVWGRPWHVPTNPAVSVRALAAQLAELAGAPRPKLKRMSPWLLRAAGLASATVREVPEVTYQFEAPFELDSTASEKVLGLEPTPLDDALLQVVRELS